MRLNKFKKHIPIIQNPELTLTGELKKKYDTVLTKLNDIQKNCWNHRMNSPFNFKLPKYLSC